MHLLVAVTQPDGSLLADLLKSALPEANVSLVSEYGELLGSAQTVAWDAAIITPDSLSGSFQAALRLLRPGTTIVIARPSDLPDIGQTLADGADDLVITDDLRSAVPEILARLAIRVAARDREERFRYRYRQVVETPGHIAYRLNADGKFTEVHGDTAALGYSTASLVGRHFTEVLDPDCARYVSRVKVLPGLSGVSTGAHGSPRLFDERRRGRRRTTGLQVTLLPGSTHGGGIEATVTSAGEIERCLDGTSAHIGSFGVIHSLKTGDRTSEVAHTLYAVAEEAPAAILVLTSNLLVEYANPGFYHRFAAHPEVILGRPVGELGEYGIDPQIAVHAAECIRWDRRWGGESAADAEQRGGARYRVVVRPVTDRAGTSRGAVVLFTYLSTPPGELEGHANTDGSTVEQLVHRISSSLERRTEGKLSNLEAVVPRHIGQLPTTGSDLICSMTTDLVSAAIATAETVDARMTVSATGDTARLAVRVSGDDNTTTVSVTDVGSPALLAVAEIARDQLSRLGGRVEITRAESALEIVLWFPAGKAATARAIAWPAGLPANGHYKLAGFLSAYTGNPDLSEEIIDIFAEETPEKLERLRLAMSAERHQDARHIAQTLATTTGTLMHDAAAAVARDLELALRAGDHDASLIALGRFEPLVREILAAIREYQENRRSS